MQLHASATGKLQPGRRAAAVALARGSQDGATPAPATTFDTALRPLAVP